MVTVEEILKAKNWNALVLPKTKQSLKDLQRKVHPDVNNHSKANDAFVKLTELFNNPDYNLRVATGSATDNHEIIWQPRPEFNDRLSIALSSFKKLDKLPEEFRRFYPKVNKSGLDHLTVSYGEGWWFVDDFPKFDSRTVVWIAKRGAAAIRKAAECGLVHGDINPNTVVLLPSKHGLMLDGWWHSVKIGDRLVLKPEAPTPAKYFGGAPADENLMVAQLAAMLTKVSEPDRLLLETLKKHSVGTTDATTLFNDVNNIATKLYGPASWHPLSNPSVLMI